MATAEALTGTINTGMAAIVAVKIAKMIDRKPKKRKKKKKR